ncbi:hypothetical protein SAMN04489761_2037 [Tenacibaculum sp. MAR_2009_124]|uniref:hypothetical protein n=1 Tax=Tenacibaculum sp. MAR_2009_124 TaxID=1250059 RepID=UPI00089A9E63|nr:hypothetical protein [Tenacibaculum sp. MAR_2009_124]SEB88033.1 hypothetical protein SAMN04489761_2037 [Tenacibaculum sp. MAR_2009_124]
MENPILIFLSISIILIFSLIKTLINASESKKWLQLFPKLFSIAFIGWFSFIWFVPMHVCWNKNIAIHKFRFQVFEIAVDTGNSGSSFSSIFFNFTPSQYGTLNLTKRIGKGSDYFKNYENHNKYLLYPEK